MTGSPTGATDHPSRRPLPAPTTLTAGFWDAAREERLVVQRCESCCTFRHYPRHRCPNCTGDAWQWTEVSGTGHIHSFTVTHQSFHPAWADRVPYVVATVELDEGIRMVSDLDEPAEAVTIGARVDVFFHHLVDEGITLPRFRLVGTP
ncbi:Zn-ribbon domain-containing OB-fold protein [Dietzia sp. B32]|uniref:Zn-ribbon domain-containing OB-fold protein n=1 Tax=Dietzia sp. B32 TaxID=2915130 RepID=UPI0021AE2DD2|nr:Zn-ribbon domain-containing OB-fold protein [Dietzia sp. B32]UVE93809.1 Zn-ribbon domain-containing OB-fold protein [Dietzia sp. B32]